MLNNIAFLKSLQYTYMDILPYILKMFFISMCTYYTFIKITNYDKSVSLKSVIVLISTILISILLGFIKYNLNLILELFILIFILSILYSIITKNKFGYSLVITIISIGINYIIFFLAIAMNFLPNVIFNLQNDYIRLLCIIFIHIIIMHFTFKIPKLKHGFAFLKKHMDNIFFEVPILNISIALIFFSIAFNTPGFLFHQKILFAFLILSVVMFVTIKKSFEIYYKQNLLIKELEEAKETIKQKDEEITKLENENLNFSKTSHSIAHKQKSLEYKLNELLQKSEIASELDIRDRINSISNNYLNKTATTELPKTNIEQLDDMLKFMQSECIKDNIDFELQVSGNIHHMVNNFIDKDLLEILLADLIRNSIIAINHSDNINHSILVNLGIIDECYSLYVYDSGIEFKIDTLLSLGQRPCSTHLDSGGTGMGFMNTFDTLRKYDASIIINELNSPSRDNYTKIIMIKFDKKNNFKISSYRSEEIKRQSTPTNFVIE